MVRSIACKTPLTGIAGLGIISIMLCRIYCFAFFVILPMASSATPSAATVGWFNTFVPGGGSFLLNEPGRGAIEATSEIGTFWAGYNLSSKSELTLDGFTETLPDTGHQTSGGVDFTRALQADVLQEIGIKAHMVSVFSAYRRAGAQGRDGQEIDDRQISDLFLAPFHAENLEDPLVYLALAFSFAYDVYDYSQPHSSSVDTLNRNSNIQYSVLYGAVYPVGSGAPEEMFYRGFLQNEFYRATGSAWAAVPMSSALYALSHSSDSYVATGFEGLYLGTLTYLNKGQLSKAIAFHFWSDVLVGLYTIARLNHDEYSPNSKPLFFNASWSFQ